jgi:hypothetical protein
MEVNSEAEHRYGMVKMRGVQIWAHITYIHEYEWCAKKLCAHLSASSKITTLCLPGGRVTFFCANILILLRTTSIPLTISPN